MVNPTLPHLCSVLKIVQELCNSACIIRLTSGNAIGVQQSLKEKLHQKIKHLIQLDTLIIESSLVKVKITGDGTCVSCSMHVVLLSFKVKSF